MIEDKLDKDQRIRLEALAQANVSAATGKTAEAVIYVAKRFEAYVRNGEK